MNRVVRYDGLPELLPRKDKLLAAMLFVLEEAEKLGRELSKGEIVKALFIADDQHLAEYGRPITFDNYVAMKKGPVGDLASDMLNDKVSWKEFSLSAAPWAKKEKRGLVFYALADTPCDESELSVSDKEELSSALSKVLAQGFERTSDKSHDHPAWRAAWGAGDKKAVAMDWRTFPGVDQEMADDLSMASRLGQ